MTWKVRRHGDYAGHLAGRYRHLQRHCGTAARQLNINALMSVAVAQRVHWAMAWGRDGDGLYAMPDSHRSQAVDRAQPTLSGLAGFGTGHQRAWTATPVASVAIGATVAHQAGLNACRWTVKVTKGNGAINQAPVTGESIPVDKAPGDQVFAGTISRDW